MNLNKTLLVVVQNYRNWNQEAQQTGTYMKLHLTSFIAGHAQHAKYGLFDAYMGLRRGLPYKSGLSTIIPKRHGNTLGDFTEGINVVEDTARS